MKRTITRTATLALGLAALSAFSAHAAPPEGEGWVSLFNGKDLTGWKIPEASDEIWTIVDGVIDCEPRADIKGDKTLWSEQSYRDFQLQIDWRLKEMKGEYPMPTILPDGSHETDAEGNIIITKRPNADSGIYLRGTSKAQLNIWCWPVGSGEVWGYRTDKNVSPEVRAGVTPKVHADNPVGEWNTFLITMKGDRVTVELNGETVLDNAQLPGVPEEGPIALQHHGGYNPKNDTWNSASSLVQFRNIYIKELK